MTGLRISKKLRRTKMKRKGFTLVELLVVIAIIALLMGILMPALTRVRQIAYRMMCASNLAGIGKAMLLYAGDNQEDFPRSGGSKGTWASSGQLVGQFEPFLSTEALAYGEAADTAPVTIGSSFYLLVKYAEVTPKQFVCKGDAGAEVFSLDKWQTNITNAGGTCLSITDAWDFGTQPGKYCSYAYQIPFNGSDFPTEVRDVAKPIRTTSKAGTPVAADRSPYFDRNNETHVKDATLTAPTCIAGDVKDPSGVLNSACHQLEGQNILYVDGSSRFEKMPNVGVDNDNIYIAWTDYTAITTDVTCTKAGVKGLTLGTPPITVDNMGPTISKAPEDAFLVNELQSGANAGQGPM